MAKSQSSNDFSNSVLARLSSERLDDLGPYLKPLELAVRSAIYQPHEAVRHAYFVESGMISVVSVMGDGKSIEVGTIGREGMAGGFLLYGVRSVPYQYYTQIAGRAYRIESEILQDNAHQDGDFRDLILRCQAAFHYQTMQTAACNGLHSVQQRCCRWILMSQDLVESDKVQLTHEFLALNARRQACKCD